MGTSELIAHWEQMNMPSAQSHVDTSTSPGSPLSESPSPTNTTQIPAQSPDETQTSPRTSARTPQRPPLISRPCSRTRLPTSRQHRERRALAAATPSTSSPMNDTSSLHDSRHASPLASAQQGVFEQAVPTIQPPRLNVFLNTLSTSRTAPPVVSPVSCPATRLPLTIPTPSQGPRYGQRRLGPISAPVRSPSSSTLHSGTPLPLPPGARSIFTPDSPAGGLDEVPELVEDEPRNSGKQSSSCGTGRRASDNARRAAGGEATSESGQSSGKGKSRSPLSSLGMMKTISEDMAELETTGGNSYDQETPAATSSGTNSANEPAARASVTSAVGALISAAGNALKTSHKTREEEENADSIESRPLIDHDDHDTPSSPLSPATPSTPTTPDIDSDSDSSDIDDEDEAVLEQFITDPYGDGTIATPISTTTTTTTTGRPGALRPASFLGLRSPRDAFSPRSAGGLYTPLSAVGGRSANAASPYVVSVLPLGMGSPARDGGSSGSRRRRSSNRESVARRGGEDDGDGAGGRARRQSRRRQRTITLVGIEDGGA